MREEVPLAEVAPRVVRITPAYAGRSAQGDSASLGREDHPRICGKKEPLSSTQKTR